MQHATKYKFKYESQTRSPGIKAKSLFDKMFEKPPYCNNELIRSSTFSLFTCAMQCALLSVECTRYGGNFTVKKNFLGKCTHDKNVDDIDFSQYLCTTA
jgi:hypothetical protein